MLKSDVYEDSDDLGQSDNIGFGGSKTPSYVANSPGYHGYQTPAGGMSHYEPTGNH